MPLLKECNLKENAIADVKNVRCSCTTCTSHHQTSHLVPCFVLLYPLHLASTELSRTVLSLWLVAQCISSSCRARYYTVQLVAYACLQMAHLTMCTTLTTLTFAGCPVCEVVKCLSLCLYEIKGTQDFKIWSSMLILSMILSLFLSDSPDSSALHQQTKVARLWYNNSLSLLACILSSLWELYVLHLSVSRILFVLSDWLLWWLDILSSRWQVGQFRNFVHAIRPGLATLDGEPYAEEDLEPPPPPPEPEPEPEPEEWESYMTK